MYETIQNLHSGWAYIVLIVLVLAVINAFARLASKRGFGSKDRFLFLVALVFTHIQFLIGIVLYFSSPLGADSLGNMKNADLRLTSLEHPLINLIAIALITIGWSKHKKLMDSTAKFKTFAIFYSLGLLLILSRLPWKLWFS